MNHTPAYPSFTITGLLFGCPFATTDRRCPLRSIRRQTPQERVRWLLTLSSPAQHELLAHHAACRRQREQKSALRPAAPSPAVLRE